MRWSWRIGRLAGIDVYMHVTFLLLLGWIAYVRYAATGSVREALMGMLFVIVLFAVIVLHELGHALTARRFGIPTRDITLYPIGGVASLQRMPEEPTQELLVALAGPAVNVVLGAILLPLTYFYEGGVAWLPDFLQSGGTFLDQLFWSNAIILGFNLLPSYPMDGGRVLRAILAMNMDYVKATQTAAAVGQAMAVIFGLVALLIGHLFLLLIAFFVFFGAAQEAGAVQTRAFLRGIPVRRAMITNYETLGPDDTLDTAIRHILAGFQQDFPVVAGNRLVGVLTRADLMAGLAGAGREGRVRDWMHDEFATADPGETLDTALPRLQACACNALPVLRDGALAGLITMDNLSELLMIQDALRRADDAGAPRPRRRSADEVVHHD
jgi:Zn-dependent protease/predicted transcriptional regulator